MFRFDDFFGKKKKETESSKKNQRSTKNSRDIEDKDEWDAQDGREDSFEESQESEKDDDPMNDAESGDNKVCMAFICNPSISFSLASLYKYLVHAYMIDFAFSSLQNNDTLSTFEKQSQIIKSQIDQIERDLLEPKSWTMTGEVVGLFSYTHNYICISYHFVLLI